MDKVPINRIEYRDGGLWIDLGNRAMARRISIEVGRMLEIGRKYIIEIKQYRKQRSLSANAYCWVLLGKLAAVLRIPKEEIYREMIRNIGDNFEIVPIPRKSVKRFCGAWRQNGEGWLTEPMGVCHADGCEEVLIYYGSSVYDSKQMSSLIDLVIQECREQGIETLPPYKLDALKEGWNAQAN